MTTASRPGLLPDACLPTAASLVLLAQAACLVPSLLSGLRPCRFVHCRCASRPTFSWHRPHDVTYSQRNLEAMFAQRGCCFGGGGAGVTFSPAPLITPLFSAW